MSDKVRQFSWKYAICIHDGWENYDVGVRSEVYANPVQGTKHTAIYRSVGTEEKTVSECVAPMTQTDYKRVAVCAAMTLEEEREQGRRSNHYAYLQGQGR